MFTKYKNQIILLLANVSLVSLLIALSNLQALPLRMGDFIFFAILALALALYRPGWAFLFFVGTIMLENVSLAPVELGLAVRPYQLFGAVTIVAIIIRLATGKLNFKLIKPVFFDWLVIALGAASFVSALFANNVGTSLKQSIVLASFIFLYFLVRNFIQSSDDVRRVVPFFASSAVVVALYSIWQNVRFSQGLSHFEVMPGRPNGTFAEADWLGMFLVFLLAVVYGVMYWERNNNQETNIKQISNLKSQISKNLYLVSCILYLVLIFTALTLTVARSAWLGALIVTFVFLLIVFTDLKFNPKKWQFKKTALIKIPILFSLILSLAIVYLFNLTSFQLSNRVQSTGTGLQEITVSCDAGSDVPRAIVDISELREFNCRHINLEDIENEKISGRVITVAYRDDPNVNIRKEIYIKSWEEIQKNPILGIGWGSISDILGKDDRGAGLNSSNIFLEVWLGAGIVGLLSLVLIWIGVATRAVKLFLNTDHETKSIGLFLIIGLFAILVPNLFNAGLMLGFLWLFLGLALVRK